MDQQNKKIDNNLLTKQDFIEFYKYFVKDVNEYQQTDIFMNI